MEYPLRPFDTWPVERHDRSIHAGHTFGMHLMETARDQARAKIPADASQPVREIAEQAAFMAVYGVMQIFDGVASNHIDDQHRVEYVLTARILRGGKPVEEFEIAPDGDGLCMAIHGWWEDEFWA